MTHPTDTDEIALQTPAVPPEADHPHARIDRWLDRWPLHLSSRMPEPWGRPMSDVLRVEEFVGDDDTLVIRAEVPGVDPDDIQIGLDHGQLSIGVSRKQREAAEHGRYVRSEFHYGSFTRHLTVPAGVAADDITANYTDGILELRVPAAGEDETTRISVTRGD